MLKAIHLIRKKTASLVRLVEIDDDGLILSRRGYSAAKKKNGEIDHDSVVESDRLQVALRLIYKPIKSVPAKWTQSHVLRCLANNQYHRLLCVGRYTDDYYSDHLNNYGKDQEVDIDKLLDDIIDMKPRIYQDKDLVKISFGFARYSFRVGFISGTPKKHINKLLKVGG